METATVPKPPLVVRQHMQPPKKYIILTSQGAYIFLKLRPVDILKNLLLESHGLESEMVKTYFRIQGEDQACAASLILACLTSPQNQEVAEYATKVFFMLGGEPKLLQQAFQSAQERSRCKNCIKRLKLYNAPEIKRLLFIIFSGHDNSVPTKSRIDSDGTKRHARHTTDAKCNLFPISVSNERNESAHPTKSHVRFRPVRILGKTRRHLFISRKNFTSDLEQPLCRENIHAKQKELFYQYYKHR